MKVTVEFAEDNGLIPKIDCFNRGSFFGITTSKIISNEEYLSRLRRRNEKYKVDNNYMVEVGEIK